MALSWGRKSLRKIILWMVAGQRVWRSSMGDISSSVQVGVTSAELAATVTTCLAESTWQCLVVLELLEPKGIESPCADCWAGSKWLLILIKLSMPSPSQSYRQCGLVTHFAHSGSTEMAICTCFLELRERTGFNLSGFRGTVSCHPSVPFARLGRVYWGSIAVCFLCS